MIRSRCNNKVSPFFSLNNIRSFYESNIEYLNFENRVPDKRKYCRNRPLFFYGAVKILTVRDVNVALNPWASPNSQPNL